MSAVTAPDPQRRSLDVRLDRLTKRFDDVVAVNDISLEIDRGHFFALLGPSGCGKTTTLRMIGGFEEPTAGQIFLGERDVGKLPSYKRDVNTVFQSYALFPHLSIFENVAFGLRRRGQKGDELKRRVLDALELVGLTGLEKRRPRQLSGGQQQRIALARALVNRPRVLLLDEPLGALDLKLRKQMQLELKRIQHEVGITFIHVTHDQEEAMTMADTIVVMNHGQDRAGGHARRALRASRHRVRRRLPRRLEPARRAPSPAPTASGSATGRVVTVPDAALEGRSGDVSIGIRPEKIQPSAGEANQLTATITESAYIGVSTQYIVETPAGSVSIYVQNDRPGAGGLTPGDQLTLSWSPESTFVVDPPEEPA